MDPMVGRVFMGRYEVQKLLGEGGMGRVYLAKQTDLQRQVVVKVMHEHVAADPKFRERFQRETMLMARFQHPYAVTLYDATLTPPDGPCIIMEYIRGEPLDAILARNRRLSPVRAGCLLGQLCEVLSAAHTQGIIHRDLKPANLMVVDPDTPYEKLKVMDFGLAKLIDRQSLQEMLDSGNEFVIGTPAYMCPEQVRGEEVDYRGDIYSVGVILYELLTGHLPFEAVSTTDMLLAHATDSPQTMNGTGDDGVWIPPPVERVVLACLSKKPANRPANARELAQRYDQALMEKDGPAESATTAEAAAGPPPLPTSDDPTAMAFQLQAWMPESVAAYKLKGFIQDVGGEVIESVPGHVRVRLGAKGSVYEVPRGGLSWFGLGSATPIEMDLQMHRSETGQQNNLWITILLRFVGRTLPGDWKSRGNQIFVDLRSYLIGSTQAAGV